MIVEYNQDSRTRRWQNGKLGKKKETNKDEVEEGVLVNLDKISIPFVEFLRGDVFLASGGIYVLLAVVENLG